VSTDWRDNEELRPAESEVVDSLSEDDCRAKALDCLIKAEASDDPRQKAAMLRYAEWWNRLADYRAQPTLNPKNNNQ